MDASILAKAFVKEEGSDKAIRILEGYLKGEYNILISELTTLETLNALKYHKVFPNEYLEKAGESLYHYGFDIARLDLNLLKKAIEIALENDITIYDATYLALAEVYGGKVITADKKLYQKVKDRFPIEIL